MPASPGLDFETRRLERTAVWSSPNSNNFGFFFLFHSVFFLRRKKKIHQKLTGVAEVDELFGEQVCEQLHDEQQVLVLVFLGRGVAALPALVVFGVDLQQRQARLVQLHGLGLNEENTK